MREDARPVALASDALDPLPAEEEPGNGNGEDYDDAKEGRGVGNHGGDVRHAMFAFFFTVLGTGVTRSRRACNREGKGGLSSGCATDTSGSARPRDELCQGGQSRGRGGSLDGLEPF